MSKAQVEEKSLGKYVIMPQGRRKQFGSGQAITKMGGPGVLPRKIMLLAGAF